MAVLKRVLTDLALNALKPAPKGKRPILWDGDVRGLGVRYNDRKPPDRSFVLVARYPGGSKNPAPRTIGSYPTISLEEARDIAREWRKDIKNGVDPRDKAEDARKAAEAAKREEQRKAQNTFEAAWSEYVEERRGDRNGRNRTLRVVDGVIKKHIINEVHGEPRLGQRPLTEITRVETNDILRKIAKDTPTHARRIASYLRTFGKWAENDGRIDNGELPFANLKSFGTENKRKRVLTDDEIRAIWKASAGMGAFGRAVRLMLVTGQRRSEVGDMDWREVDAAKKLWTLPPERTKADRDHLVPLSELALSILNGAERLGSHVFTTRAPCRRKEDQGGPSATAPISGWSKFKKRLDVLALAELKRLADDDATLPEWHLHDLRRTAATRMTGMGKLGVTRLHVSFVLNHSVPGVTGVYDLYEYLPEKRHALDLWGERLKAMVDEGREGPDSEETFFSPPLESPSAFLH